MTIALGLTVMAAPVRAQIHVILFGWVEDVVSKEVMEGALIIDEDSTNAVLTDPSCAFALSESSARRISLLRLIPAATAGYGVKPGNRIRISS